MTTLLLVLVAALVVAVVVAFLLRRRFLLSGLGAVTMWLRRPDSSSRWSVGVAWYGGDTLLWYRALSLAVRPQHRLCRASLRVDGQRPVVPQDVSLPPEVVVLTCSTDTGTAELAMDPSTVTGFLSWVESAPPVR